MTMALPEYLQTKTYSAMRLRQVLLDQRIREGIAEYTALKASQRSSGGANLSVDIAAGPAFVQGDTTSRQGLYHVYNDAVVNLAIGTNTSGSPRIDQVVARVYDSQDGLAGSDQATLEILPGSAQAGATLDNRNGAAVLPLTCMRIADILVPASASGIVNANIRDRRPFAKPLVIDVVAVSGLDLPVDSRDDSYFTLEHDNVETSAISNINMRMNGDTSNIYSLVATEQMLVSTPGNTTVGRGGYNSTTSHINMIGNSVAAGGMRYNGIWRQGMVLHDGLIRLGRGNASASSRIGSGNHVLSAFSMAGYINSANVWHTVTLWLVSGTMTGRFILDRVPLAGF